MIMGLFGLLSRAKNYALQFVLGHRLVKARQPGLDAGTVATVSEFENLIDQLLGEVVDRHGKVNYERLAQPQGRQRLSNLAQFIAQHSPRSEPDSFPTRNDQLAFYMNAYNVLVLWGVVNNWPLKSVHDCRVWVRLVCQRQLVWRNPCVTLFLCILSHTGDCEVGQSTTILRGVALRIRRIQKNRARWPQLVRPRAQAHQKVWGPPNPCCYQLCQWWMPATSPGVQPNYCFLQVGCTCEIISFCLS